MYSFEFVCIYLCMCIYVSIHTYILEQGRWLGWYQWPPASQPSPMISYGDCKVRITQPFGCPLITCAFSCDASNAWPLGPAAFFREVRKKRTMTYGPIWSKKWWEMVPDTHLQKSHGQWVVRNGSTSIWMSISIHWFIDQVDWSRSISTVDKDSPTWEYNTVDIDGR